MSDMKIKLLHRRIDEVVNYLKPLLPFANSHMVEFLSMDLWNKFIPRQIIDEVETYGASDAINTFWDQRTNIDSKTKQIPTDVSPSFSVKDAQYRFKNLIDFIEEAETHYLKSDDVLCLSVEQLRERLTSLGAPTKHSLKLNEFMSDKKSHEVEVLSSIVGTIASWSGAQYTVELGGGRGYLSNMLNMLYGMPVLNIDRCEVNQRGAHERNRKIQKQWNGLVRKAVKTDSTDNNMNSSVDTEKSKQLGINSNLYRHVTEYITQHTDIGKLVSSSFECKADVNVCLTGLHTCGDLGPTSLKLYARCSAAVALCTVPCCYHLVSERTDEGLLSESMSCVEDCSTTGFPMSDYLKDFTIGRNARMLASQSIDKCSVTRDVSSLSLYYRALFEVLLKKKHDNGNSTAEGKMKNVASKCRDFSDYINMAIKKLHIEPQTINLSDAELNQFDSEHRNSIDKLTLYYLLRLCLAQVIENLILLDRLLFLSENGLASDNFRDSFLVKMFDPVISPRCHAMISYKKR